MEATMRTKLIIIGIVTIFVIFVGCQLGAAVENLGNEIATARTTAMGQ